MAKVNFKLNAKKYQLEFLTDNKVKIIALESKTKDIIISKETKIKNFIKYILSLELK